MNNRIKIITIIGARPQFIKASTVSRAIKNHPDIKEVIIHTGQHFDSNMSDVFFYELDIPKPDYNLGVGGGNHGAQTGRMLEGVEEIFLKEKPDWVLVYGDTNSTLAGALAAAKLHIPVAHVEAGLRSFNKKMPEEINRILTDHLSSILFIPTKNATENLLREGIQVEKVVNVGDVMFDAALFYGKKAEEKSEILNKIGLKSKNYILATIHRAENTDSSERLLEIFSSLEQITNKFQLILPLHPRTKKSLEAANWDFKNSKIKFVEPLGYLDMVMLEKNAQLIITDSGGVQKEAYFHEVPCVTLRNETEWIELVENGFNTLVKNLDELETITVKTIHNETFFDRGSNLYGDGEAAYKIVENLKRYHA